MSDIIDGRVWQKEMQMFGSTTLGFLLNIDWFQPFKDVSYSVGVSYFVLASEYTIQE